METSTSINLEACRFCLKISENMVQINFKIKMNFMELMNEELLENPQFPQQSCHKCSDQLTKFMNFKKSIYASQNQLLAALESEIKTEKHPAALVKVEIEDSFEEDQELRTYFEEFSQIVNPTIKEEYEPEKEESSPSPKLKLSKKSKKSSSKKSKAKSLDTRPSNSREKCGDCKLYVHQKNLLSHKIKKHNYPLDYLYKCDLCGFKLNHKSAVLSHMLKSHLKKSPKKSSERVPCEVCNKMILRYNYRVHVKFVHEKPVEKICEHCGMAFPSFPRYIHHIRAQHTGERPFKCDFCDLTFYSRSICTTHMSNQHTSKESICDLCGQVFKNRSYLRTHIRYVHEARQIVCEIEGCGMKFASNYKLRQHQTKHSEARNYICKICGAAYKKGNGLRTHIRTVHFKSSYMCELPGCNSTYHRKDFLRAHIRSAHKHLTEDQVQEIFQRLRDIPLPSLKSYHELEVTKDKDSE